MKRIIFEKKTAFPSPREPRLEISQSRNWKDKRLINKYPNEQHPGPIQSNLCRCETSLWKSRVFWDKSEGTGEKRILRRYRDGTKQNYKNRTFQNNERKFYLKVGEESMKTVSQPDARGAKRFWSKVWKQRDHNKKDERESNIEKKVAKCWRKRQSEYTHWFPQSNTPKNTKLVNSWLWWHTWILV